MRLQDLPQYGAPKELQQYTPKDHLVPLDHPLFQRFRSTSESLRLVQENVRDAFGSFFDAAYDDVRNIESTTGKDSALNELIPEVRAQRASGKLEPIIGRLRGLCLAESTKRADLVTSTFERILDVTAPPQPDGMAQAIRYEYRRKEAIDSLLALDQGARVAQVMRRAEAGDLRLLWAASDSVEELVPDDVLRRARLNVAANRHPQVARLMADVETMSQIADVVSINCRDVASRLLNNNNLQALQGLVGPLAQWVADENKPREFEKAA
jgi:hypothetical protein